MAGWLLKIGGREVPCYAEAAEEGRQKVSTSPATHGENRSTPNSNQLHVSCHCRGVQFYITRPTSPPRAKHGFELKGRSTGLDSAFADRAASQ